MGSVRKDQMFPGGNTEKIDLRFIHTEEKIHRVLCSMLGKRRLAVRVSEFCREAEISRPTLMAHCNGIGDAMLRYEHGLLEEFSERLELWGREREAVFTTLLGFIYQKQEYFLATIPNRNYTVVYTMLELATPMPKKPAAGHRAATLGGEIGARTRAHEGSKPRTSNESQLTISPPINTAKSAYSFLLHHQLAVVVAWADQYKFMKSHLPAHAKFMAIQEQRLMREFRLC